VGGAENAVARGTALASLTSLGPEARNSLGGNMGYSVIVGPDTL
jgi:hypothetical protein